MGRTWRGASDCYHSTEAERDFMSTTRSWLVHRMLGNAGVTTAQSDGMFFCVFLKYVNKIDRKCMIWDVLTWLLCLSTRTCLKKHCSVMSVKVEVGWCSSFKKLMVERCKIHIATHTWLTSEWLFTVFACHQGVMTLCLHLLRLESVICVCFRRIWGSKCISSSGLVALADFTCQFLFKTPGQRGIEMELCYQAFDFGLCSQEVVQPMLPNDTAQTPKDNWKHWIILDNFLVYEWPKTIKNHTHLVHSTSAFCLSGSAPHRSASKWHLNLATALMEKIWSWKWRWALARHSCQRNQIQK